MKMLFEKVKNCPICGYPQVLQLFELNELNSFELRIVACSRFEDDHLERVKISLTLDDLDDLRDVVRKVMI